MGTDQLAYGDDGDDGTITREQYRRLAKAGKATVKARPTIASKPRRRGNAAQRWQCHACGQESASYAAAERHAAEPGHARIECVP